MGMEEILNKYAEEIEDYNLTIDEQVIEIKNSKNEIVALKTKLQEAEAETANKLNDITVLQEEIENSKNLIAEMKNLNLEYSKQMYSLKKDEESVANSLRMTEKTLSCTERTLKK